MLINEEQKRRGLSSRQLLLVFTVTSFGLVSNAQSADSDNGAQPKIEEIVVTARKVEENVQDVPIAITAFSGDTFENAGLTEFSDISQLTPNFDIRANPVAGSQFAVSTIRGQTNAFFTLNIDQAIAISVNGAPITRGTSLFSNLFDVERVEVLKGPQGTLFGKNSTGGAINLVTKAPVLNEFGGHVQFTAGNFDRLDGEAVLNLPLISDTLALRLGAKISNRDGFGVTDDNVVPGAAFQLSDDDEQAFRASLLFEPNDNFSLRVNADYKEVEEAPVIQRGLVDVFLPIEIAPGVFIQVPLAAAATDPDPFVGDFFAGAGRPFRDPFAKAEEFNINATAIWDIGEVTLTSVTSYRDQESQSELQNAVSTSIFLGQEADLFAQELRLSGTGLQDRLIWQAGVFYSDESGFDNDTLPQAFQFQVVEVENQTFSIFTQNSLDLTDQLTLTLGLRYTTEDRELRDAGPGILGADGIPVLELGSGPLFEGDETFDAFSWLASLDYKLTDDTLIYASVSRGFRSGGLDQDNLGSTFDAEFVVNYETGLKADFFDSRVRFNAAVFFSDYTDIQILAAVPLTGNTGAVTTVLDNAGEASIWGFELELSAQPVDGLLLGATFAHTDGEFDEFLEANPAGGFTDRSDEPIGGQEFTFTLSGRYEFDLSPGILAGVQANYFWVNDFELQADDVIATLDSGGTLDSYGILNAQVDLYLDSIAKGLKVALFATNLTDEEFLPSGFVIPFGPIGTIDNRITGEPRTYGVRLTQQF